MVSASTSRVCLADVRRASGYSGLPRRPPSVRIRFRCGPSSRNARRPTVRSADSPLPPSRGAFSRPGVRSNSPRPGASVLKIGSRCFDHAVRPADHLAIAALQAPHAAAGADVDILNSLGRQVPWRGEYRRCNTNCRRRSRYRRISACGVESRASVASTTAAGTISQMARGVDSLPTKSVREATPVGPPLPVAGHSRADSGQTPRTDVHRASTAAPCWRPCGRVQSFRVACASAPPVVHPHINRLTRCEGRRLVRKSKTG